MRPDYAELARKLQENHCFKNGCWQTNYDAIKGLRVTATTTSGTGGIGFYYGSSVYWGCIGDRFEVNYHRR